MTYGDVMVTLRLRHSEHVNGGRRRLLCFPFLQHFPIIRDWKYEMVRLCVTNVGQQHMDQSVVMNRKWRDIPIDYERIAVQLNSGRMLCVTKVECSEQCLKKKRKKRRKRILHADFQFPAAPSSGPPRFPYKSAILGSFVSHITCNLSQTFKNK